MSKHHNDGTKITLDTVKSKIENDEYGPEVVDTIKFLVDYIDNMSKYRW